MKKSLCAGLFVSFVWCVLLVTAARGGDDSDAKYDIEPESRKSTPKREFRMEDFSPSDRATLQGLRAQQGRMSGSRVREAVSILTDTNAVKASSSQSVIPAYSLSRTDVVGLFGAPDDVTTNKRGNAVLSYDLAVDDAIVDRMVLVIVICDGHVKIMGIGEAL